MTKGSQHKRLSREHSTGLRVCQQCQKERPWIFQRGEKGKCWVDENGRKWNSATCYDCHKNKYSAEYFRKRRARLKTKASYWIED